jgi:hypothetical protein
MLKICWAAQGSPEARAPSMTERVSLDAVERQLRQRWEFFNNSPHLQLSLLDNVVGKGDTVFNQSVVGERIHGPGTICNELRRPANEKTRAVEQIEPPCAPPGFRIVGFELSAQFARALGKVL